MASSIKDITVSLVGGCIEVLVVNPTKPNAPSIYSVADIKSVVPIYNAGIGRNGINTPTTYPFTDQKQVVITFSNESTVPSLVFDLETVANQPGWTLDLAGLTQAVADLCGWVTSLGGALTGFATEATLLALNNQFVAVIRTPGLINVLGVSSASVAAGSRAVSFFNYGPVAATVNGSTLAPGRGVDFAAGGENDTLAAIPYVTIATGDLDITTIV